MFFRNLMLTIAIALLLVTNASAESTGNIGVNFSQVIDDRSTGLTGEYNYEGNGFGFEADADLQTGDIYRGTLHAELSLNLVKQLGIKVITDTTGKGYTLDTLGRDTNAFIAGTVKIEAVNIDIGIGGKSAAPWGAPNALNDLLPKGYNEDELLAIGADQITPAPRGVPFQDGAFLQAYGATGLTTHGWEVDVKGILQLTGEDKAHQVKVGFDKQFALWDDFTANLGGEVIVMSYQEAVHTESAWFLGLGYQW